MRRLSSIAIFAAVAVIISGPCGLTKSFAGSGIDRAVVTIAAPVTLKGVVLNGRYLFIHHDGMMSKGLPCAYVYSLQPESEGRLVVSFHCISVKRERADEFKMVLGGALTGLPAITEIQFAGSTHGHQVPEEY